MAQKFLVLGVKAYDFSRDGERLSGMKVIYVDQPENSEMIKGYLPMQAPADISILPAFNISEWPAIYGLDFRQKPDPKTGRPTLTVISAEFFERAECCLPLEV